MTTTYPIDLHAHTTASDGTHTPTQLVQRAANLGLQVLGIADHDTIDGLAEAQAAGKTHGVEIVPAVEFSTRHQYDRHFVGIHMLGYFVDPQAPALVSVMNKVKQGRVAQKIQQIEKLQSFGFDIPVEAVFERVTGVPGRPHIAAVLVERNPDKFDSIQQVFDEYLGSKGRVHVKRPFALTVGEAIAVIKAAGGLPVFAHPGAYDAPIDPLQAVRNAHAEGAEGVEVYYPYDQGHRPAEDSQSWVARTQALAQELALLQTGGTDFHGRPQDRVELGDMGLTAAQFAQLKQGWQKLRGHPAESSPLRE